MLEPHVWGAVTKRSIRLRHLSHMSSKIPIFFVENHIIIFTLFTQRPLFLIRRPLCFSMRHKKKKQKQKQKQKQKNQNKTKHKTKQNKQTNKKLLFFVKSVTAGSTVTTQINFIAAVNNSDYTVSVQSQCSYCA